MNEIEKMIKLAEEVYGQYPSKRGWHPLVFPTSLFIRDYLMLKGEDYPFHMYRVLSEIRGRLGIKIGSPINFYKIIWCLEKLGLIERTGRVEVSFRDKTQTQLPRRMWRVYYRIKKGMETSPLWLNPQKEIAKIRGWKSIPGKKK